MAVGATFKNDLAKLIFWGTPITGIADNAASSPYTVFWLALHIASPTDAGNQGSNETSYTGYARVTIDRDSDGFSITNNIITLTATMTFPQCTGGSATITHVSIGTSETGTGKLLMHGAISPTIPVSSGVSPQLGTGSTITLD
jgi:hypothetical protein